jgi:hypothetical protein
MKFLNKLFGNTRHKQMKQDELKSPEAIKAKLLGLLAPFKKTAFIPKTEQVDGAFNADSKFGGLPYLRSSDDWPVCPNCQNHMQLFLQLNLRLIPNGVENALIQLFYCTNETPCCDSDCEAYSAFSKSVVCRKIDIQNQSMSIKPMLENIFPERRIIGWDKIDDFPHYEEFSELGLNIDLDEYDIIEQEGIGIPATGDKLFGWPYWVQSVEYPFDRNTHSQMQLVFQLDSEINLPYMFGDCGIGHITQSPDNSSELAFAWACY